MAVSSPDRRLLGKDMANDQDLARPMSDFESDLQQQAADTNITLQASMPLEVIAHTCADVGGVFAVSYTLEAKAQTPQLVETRIRAELYKGTTLIATMFRVGMLWQNRTFAESGTVSARADKDDVFTVRLTATQDIQLINVQQALLVHKT